MKKLFLMLSLVLTAVFGAYALSVDDILGRWDSNTIKHDPTPEMPIPISEKYIIEYKADGEVTLKNEGSISFGDGSQGIDMFLKFTAPGTYTVAGDSITIVCDVEKVKIDFTEDDIRIRGIEDAAQAEEIRTEFYNQFSQNIEGMKAGFEEPMVINDVMVAGKQMTCKVDDVVVIFKRKKK